MLAKNHVHLPTTKKPLSNFWRLQQILTLQGLPGFLHIQIEFERGKASTSNYLAIGAPNGGAMFTDF